MPQRDGEVSWRRSSNGPVPSQRMRGSRPRPVTFRHRRPRAWSTGSDDMTGPGSPHQPRSWLEVAARALEVGDWWHVDHSRPSVALPEGSASLVALQRVVASSMAAQARGHVEVAWQQLGNAARLLPRGLSRPPTHGDTRLVVLMPPPTDEPDVARWIWQTARVIWREQHELEDLRARLSSEDSPRFDLTCAGIEHLRWGEFDPFVWCRPAVSGDRAGVHRSRSNLCARANRLRKFAEPTAKDLSASVWRHLDGYHGLRAEALTWLAHHDLVPWTSGNALADAVPVRLGRLRAWDYAKLWHADLHY